LETATKRLYEGMFLVDSAQAAADWDGTLAVIETILKRADADVVSMRKWGERRLAYEINHQTRGTYILCYFKANGQRIAGMEKDVQLSEKVMRVLILGTEKRPAKMLEADIAGPSTEADASASERQRAEASAPKAVAETPAEAGAAPEPAPTTEGEASQEPKTPVVETPAVEPTAEGAPEATATETAAPESAPASDEPTSPVEAPAAETETVPEAGSEQPEKL